MKRSIVTSDVIDLTNEDDEEPSQKKTKNNFSQGSSGLSRQSKEQKQRQWIQMGWKSKASHNGQSSSSSQSKAQAADKKDSKDKTQSYASFSKPQSLMSLNFPSPDAFSHPSDQFRKKTCPDPDSFLPIIDRLCSTIPLSKLENGPKWRQLSQSIVSLFNDRQQERKVLKRKIELWKELYLSLIHI